MNIQKALARSSQDLKKVSMSHWLAIGLGCVVLLVVLSITKSSWAGGTGVYQAKDLLGQLDDTHVHVPIPGISPIDFMAAYDNNRPPINDRGLAPHSTASVVDTINHRLFVSDFFNYRVLVFNLDSSNNLVDRSADFVLGEPDLFTRSLTPAAANSFDAGGGSFGTGSGGMDIDLVHQRLFVADAGNNRVLVFDLTSISNNMNASFVLGQIDFVSNAFGTTATTMKNPTDVVYDSAQDRLYVADSENNRILGFDLSSGIANGMVADQVIGQVDSFSAVDSNNLDGLSEPTGLGIDPGKYLFIASPNSSGTSLRVFDLATLPGAGATAAYAIPTGMTYDAAFDTVSKKLYVTSFLFATGVTVYDFSIPGNNPPVLTTLGASAGTSATTTSQTKGIYFDGTSGNLYVNDNGNNRVLIYAVGMSGSSLVPNMPATNNVGQLNAVDQPIFATHCLNNRCPNAEGFDNPTGTDLDISGGRTFVSDAKNNRVLIFNGSREASFVLGQDEFYKRAADTLGSDKGLNLENSLTHVNGVAYDASKEVLYIADTGNNRIMVYDLSGTISNGMVASGVIGQSGFSQVAANRGGAVGNNTLSQPSGLSIDPVNHKLYVADTGNNRVLKYDLGSSVPLTAEDVFGQSDFVSAVQDVGHMHNPEDMVFDSSTQRLWVTDTGNNRVVSFITTGAPASHSPEYVLGQATLLTNTSGTTATTLSSPKGIRFDTTERKRLFIADSANNRVAIYDLTHTIASGMAVDSVIGQSDLVTGASSVSSADFNAPASLSYDAVNNALYVSDQSNHRVALFRFIELVPATLANGLIGTPYSQTIGANAFVQGTVSLSLESGSLPPGLSLAGVTIVGTPTTAGTYTFTLRGIDTMNPDIHYYDLETYTITVTATPTPQDGICGGAHAVPVSSSPSSSLCSLGTASGVSGTGPWTWTCSGVNGGSPVACSAPVVTTTSGGSSSGSTGGGRGCPWGTAWNGSVCVTPGVTPVATPVVTTTPALVCPYFTKYVKYRSGDNDPDEVRKIQDFLVARGYLTGNYTYGTYDLNSFNAVKSFQGSFWNEVINPWNLEGPTGWWYKTSRFKANAIVGCPEKEVFLERVDFWWRGLQNTLNQII